MKVEKPIEFEYKGMKVILKEITEDDLRLLMEWRNRNRQWFFDPAILTLEKQQAWYQEYLQKEDYQMFMIQKKDGEKIGAIGISNIDLTKGTAEIRSVMTRDGEDPSNKMDTALACYAMIKYAFCELKLKEIYGGIFEDNERSLNLAKQLGSKVIGVETRYGRPAVILSLTAEAAKQLPWFKNI